MPHLATRRLLVGIAAAGLLPLTLIGAVTPAQAVTHTITWGSVTDLDPAGTYVQDPSVFMAADGTRSVLVAIDEGLVSWSSVSSVSAGAWSSQVSAGTTHDMSYWSVTASTDAKTVVAAYMDENDTNDAFVVVSNDGGATWRTEATLNSALDCDIEDEIPAVAVSPTGDVIAVVYRYDRCTKDAVVRVSTDGGATWGAEEILPQQVELLDPQIRVLDDGRAVIVWRDSNYKEVLLSTRSTSGAWSDPTNLDDPTSEISTWEPFLDVSPDGTRFATVWRERDGYSDPFQVFVRTGEWSGDDVTLDPLAELVSTTAGMSGLSFEPDGIETSVNGETVAINIKTTTAQYVVVSTDGGETFALSPVLGGESLWSRLSLSDSGQVIHMSWSSYNTEHKSYTATSVDAGQTWSAKAQLVDSDGNSPMTATNWNGSKVIGAWVGDADGHFYVTGGTVLVSATPGAPATVTAVNDNGTITVTWTTPPSSGAGTISNYYIVVVGGGSCMVNASTFTCVVSSLNITITYTVIIYVQSEYGWSAPQVLKTTKPATAKVPGKPRTPAGVAGNAKVAVAWLVPLSDGGSAITSYLVTSTPGTKTCTATAPAVTCEVKSLTNGTAYTFAVVARNAVGPGLAATTSSVTPVAPAEPSAPRDLAGESADRSIVATWKKPASSGTQPITEYKVTAKPGGESCTVNPDAADKSFSCTITGLANGSDYTLSATAKNSVGLSPKAVSSPVLAATVAGKVRDLVIDGVTSQGVTLSWRAPLDNGGAKVTAYRVRYQPENATSDAFTFYADVTKPTVVVKGLAKGRWFFSVRAVNVAGTGAFVVTTKAAKVL